jgi:hypothetical protein
MTDDVRTVSPQEASGNPFKTAELLDDRWRQRRQLRCVPDFTFDKARPTVEIPRFDDPNLRQLAEKAVRDRADSFRVGPLAKLLDGGETALRTYVLSEVLTRPGLGSPLEPLSEEADAAAREAYIGEVDRELAPALDIWLLLMFLADDLADDGYQDWRRKTSST